MTQGSDNSHGSGDKPDGERTSQTTVDLGDDLLERTAVHTSGAFHIPAPVDDVQTPAERTPSLPSTAEEIDDQLQSAKILVNEGLIEEGKKLLRRILIADPRNLVARKRLDEIQELELKQIIGGTEPARRRPRLRGEDPELEGVHSENVLRELDRDLGLGLVTEGNAESVRRVELSLFADRAAMADFAERVDREYAAAPARDRLDVGIAFLEMGLLDLAIRQFRPAARQAETRLPATALLAWALLQSGHAFEAALALEPLINDSELPEADQVEPAYLMGRCHEQLGRADEAARWYARALAREAAYRDAEERLKRCAAIRS
jgi:tetratricopeptide (TPR) repeat protein